MASNGQRWVALMWAKGDHGQMKIALTLDEEPGPDKLAELRGKISGYYKVAFGDWPSAFDAIGRNDGASKHPTFTY